MYNTYKKLLVFEGKLYDNMETTFETLFILIIANHRQRKQIKLMLKAKTLTTTNAIV